MGPGPGVGSGVDSGSDSVVDKSRIRRQIYQRRRTKEERGLGVGRTEVPD